MPKPKLSPLGRRIAYGALLLALGTLGATLLRSEVAAKPRKRAVAVATPSAVAADGGTPAPVVPDVPSDQSRIIFSTVPPAHALVTWGKKTLGKIAPRQALVVMRPRDSGPLDVTIRAAGYLPVTTRAHTFAPENRVAVKLTPVDQKTTLLGYRAPLDAGTPLLPEAEQGEVVLEAAPP